MGTTRKAAFKPAASAAWKPDALPAYEGGGGGTPPPPTEFTFDFTGGSLPVGATLTRASPGTYFNSSGVLSSASNDVARFDHSYDGSVWSLAGLLVEPQRTNGIPDSEAFISWSTDAMTRTADAAASPDGAVTADRLLCNAGHAIHAFRRNLGDVFVGASVNSWLSCFLKADTHQHVYLGEWSSDVGFRYAAFDVVDNHTDISHGGDSALDARVQDCAGGWRRCFAEIQTGGNQEQPEAGFMSAADLESRELTAAGTEAFFLWGYQYEVGAFPTSYIKTSGGSATRAADLLTLDLANGDWDLEVITPNGAFTGSITVAGSAGYEFDWADLTGASIERHIRSVTATPQ